MDGSGANHLSGWLDKARHRYINGKSAAVLQGMNVSLRSRTPPVLQGMMVAFLIWHSHVLELLRL